MDYDKAVKDGEIRKIQMMAEIEACPARFVTYGDGDLGVAVEKNQALADIDSMDPESIGEGTWYPCDKNGKVLTASQLAAAALGSVTSTVKAAAAKANGSKGGRPVENTTRIENIRKAIVNGQQVKLFDVRKFRDRCWVFYGTFKAPARTANKNLGDFIE